jgi:hypothetical protein
VKPAKLLGLLLLGAGFAYLLTVNLDVLPGLHGDEAWVGLRARQILLGGERSIHGMNGYTGAAFPYLVAASFRAFGMSVGSLRGIGAALNLATIGLLAATAAVVGRGRGLFALLFLIGGSTLMTSKTRVAWELTACGPVLAALGILTCALWLHGEGRLSSRSAILGSVAVFLTNATGVYNHFIFIAFAVALFVATTLTALHHATERAVQLLIVQAVSTANIAVLAGAKLLLFSTQTSVPWAGFIVVASLVVEGAFVGSLLTSARSPVASIGGTLSRRAARISRAVWALIAIGAVAFGGFHLVAFIQTLANDVVLARLYSESMRARLLEASVAFAALLVALYVRTLVRALKRRLAVSADAYFLVVLPACCAAALPLVVTSNTIRYYLLPNVAFIMGVWVAWLTLSRTASCLTLAMFIGYAAWLNVYVVGIVNRRDHYESARPIRVDLGLEDFRRFVVGTGQRPPADPAPNRGSAHFLSTQATFERMRRDGVTEVETTQAAFIKGPLEFYGRASPAGIAAGSTAVINYDEHAKGGLAYSLIRDAGGP